MAGRSAYSARLPLLTPAASALAVNGTTVGAILAHAYPQRELRSALVAQGATIQPQQIDARINLLCTGLGLLQSGIWAADQTGGQVPPPAPVPAPAPAPGGTGGTPPVVPPNVDPPNQATLEAEELLRRLQPQSQEEIPSPQFSPPVPTPSQRFASSLGMNSGTPPSSMSGFTVTPSPPDLPDQSDLVKRVDNMVSLVRSLEPELVEIQKAYRAFIRQTTGAPPPPVVPPPPPPSVRFAAPVPTRAPTESEVWDVDQVPRKRRRKQSLTASADQSEDTSDGETVEAPSLDTPQGVASIDKVRFLPLSGSNVLVPPTGGRKYRPLRAV